MQPIDRFKKSITEGNLWIYILSLAKGQEICNDDVPRLIFEKFGFMPSGIVVNMVLFRLRQQGMISNEKHLGKNAYRTTVAGEKELGQINDLCKEILEKINK